ncbi:hypothetical protein NQ318_022998 [Aromia moschata]|uniref:Uncharacterized protein n=1 Tax=Aromia moschata TaxID=1265417 RepID=A0AAV8YBQ3_9CUCU|nr:hypothetical protein NQ318_022998 [Aromia moschata]
MTRTFINCSFTLQYAGFRKAYLDGDSLNLIKTKSIISAFLARIKLMKQNIGRGEFSQFPNLSRTNCHEDDVLTYVQHLNSLYADFKIRFEDVLNMELIGISTNEDLKVQFRNGYQLVWLLKDIPVTYVMLFSKMQY